MDFHNQIYEYAVDVWLCLLPTGNTAALCRQKSTGKAEVVAIIEADITYNHPEHKVSLTTPWGVSGKKPEKKRE